MAIEATGNEISVPRRADPYTNPLSREFGFRRRRFAQVERLIQAVLNERGRARILDLGGTESYWLIGEEFLRRNGHRLEIVLVNTEAQKPAATALFRHVQASASDPALFRGERFDLVHSNSVIEHVGDWEEMRLFAANTRRLADRYYVQTPNYWFPFEPHFRTVGFQYLPAALRTWMLTRMPLGFFRRVPVWEEAREVIDHNRLISARQVAALFPDAAISRERVFGLSKSIIAVRG